MKNIENHEATTDICKDFFIKCCDKMYVAMTDDFTFRGILLNYNNGNIVMYNPTQETICHIPFSELKVLYPKSINTKKKGDYHGLKY